MLYNNAYKIDFILDKKAYQSGDQVNGSVRLNFKNKFPGNKVYLTIKGTETIQTNSSTNSRLSITPPELLESTNNDNRQRGMTNGCILTTSTKNEIFSSECLLKQFNEKEYMLNQYELPFNFYLWSNIPSTCKYKWWMHYKENVLKVAYIITVKIISKDFEIDNLEHRKEFCVNNIPAVEEGMGSQITPQSVDINLVRNGSFKNSMNFINLRHDSIISDEKHESVITMNKCMCLKGGFMSFQISLNPKVYVYDENIYCTIYIDNRESSKSIKNIKQSLIKKLKITTEDKYYKKNIIQSIEKEIHNFGVFDILVKANCEAKRDYELKIHNYELQKEDVTCYGQLFSNRFYIKCELVLDNNQSNKSDFAQTEVILINRDKSARVKGNESVVDSNEPWTPITIEPQTALLMGDSMKFDSVRMNSNIFDNKNFLDSFNNHSERHSGIGHQKKQESEFDDKKATLNIKPTFQNNLKPKQKVVDDLDYIAESQSWNENTKKSLTQPLNLDQQK